MRISKEGLPIVFDLLETEFERQVTNLDQPRQAEARMVLGR